MKNLCLTILTLLAVTSTAIAQEAADAKTFVYEGRVVNTSGIPIKDVFVGSLNTDSRAVTGIDGVFRLTLPVEGDSVVIAKRGLQEYRDYLLPGFKIVFIISPESTAWLPYTEYVEKMKGTAKVYYDEGLKYLAGDSGKEPDYSKAFACFFRSACMEDAHAAYQLGRMYDEGLWGDKDYAKAINWYKKAKGVADAQTRMGIMYAEGRGVEQNYKTAISHFSSATYMGDTIEARRRMEEIYDKGLVPRPKIEESDFVFDVPETSAKFPGDVYAWLSKNIRYPATCQEQNIQGRVSIQFVINKDGSIVDVIALRAPDPRLAKEGIRVVSSMPKWKPATQGNKPVRQRYVLPVMFRLS